MTSFHDPSPAGLVGGDELFPSAEEILENSELMCLQEMFDEVGSVFEEEDLLLEVPAQWEAKIDPFPVPVPMSSYYPAQESAAAAMPACISPTSSSSSIHKAPPSPITQQRRQSMPQKAAPLMAPSPLAPKPGMFAMMMPAPITTTLAPSSSIMAPTKNKRTTKKVTPKKKTIKKKQSLVPSPSPAAATSRKRRANAVVDTSTTSSRSNSTMPPPASKKRNSATTNPIVTSLPPETSFFPMQSMQDDEESRRIRNKEHAKRSRLRKKELIHDLEECMEELKKENEMLRQTIYARLGKAATKERIQKATPTSEDLIANLKKPGSLVVDSKGLTFLRKLSKQVVASKGSGPVSVTG